MRYSKVRIAILTFILGIVSVPFINGQYEKWTEITVDLPQIISDTPLIVDIYPTKRLPLQDTIWCRDMSVSKARLDSQSRRPKKNR